MAATPALLLLAPFVGARTTRSFALLAGSVALSLAIPIAVVATGAFALPPGRFEALSQAVRATDMATAPSDRIFVGLTATRYAFTNPLIAYYLADRAPGTTETMFNPGITNTDRVQRKIVAELQATQTRVLLFDDAFSQWYEPLNDSRIPGSTILDEFVASRYRVMCVFGDYRVMAEADGGGVAPRCPDPAGQP
jgi:hypothetical protein